MGIHMAAAESVTQLRGNRFKIMSKGLREVWKQIN